MCEPDQLPYIFHFNDLLPWFTTIIYYFTKILNDLLACSLDFVLPIISFLGRHHCPRDGCGAPHTRFQWVRIHPLHSNGNPSYLIESCLKEWILLCFFSKSMGVFTPINPLYQCHWSLSTLMEQTWSLVLYMSL